MSTDTELADFGKAAERVFGEDISGENINEIFAGIISVNGNWMRRIACEAAMNGAAPVDIECLIDAAAHLLAGAMRDEGMAGFADGLIAKGEPT